MNDQPTKLREAFELLRREEQQQAGDHLGFDQLLSFHRHELTAADEDAVDRHLTWCTACVERSLGLARALRPADGLEEEGPDELDERGEPAEPVDPAYVASLWRKVQPLLKPIEPANVRAFPVRELGKQNLESSGRWWPRQTVLRPLAAAAVIAATLVALGWWMARDRPVEDLAELNVPIESLEAEDFVRLSGPERGREVPIVAPGAVLILTPGKEPRAESYRVEIFEELSPTSPILVWQGDGLAPAPEGNFRLRLPRDLRPATEYRIRVVARDGSYATDFRLRLDLNGG